jgi:hypothetical protein
VTVPSGPPYRVTPGILYSSEQIGVALGKPRKNCHD